MAHSGDVKDQAILLRQKGYSLKEISQIVHVSKSTTSIWVRQVSVSPSGITRMADNKELKRYKMSLKWQQVRADKKLYYRNLALPIVQNIRYSQPINKLLCAILFWAEGSKTIDRIAFTNSDPRMIQSFLRLLRASYDLDETKFSVSAHLHEYHNQDIILNFWANTTNIPLTQFIRPYIKPHTGKNIHAGYKGCITIRYYDRKIAYELEAIYNVFSEQC